MTLQQYAALFNIAGIMLVLLVSTAVAATFKRPFFRLWIRAYGFLMLALMAEWVAGVEGRTWPLTLATVVLSVTSSWYLVRAALVVGSNPTLPSWAPWTVTGSLIGASAVLLATRPFPTPLLPMLLFSTLGFAWLGVNVLRGDGRTGGTPSPWLGWPLIALGLSPLTFPLWQRTSVFWLGYFLSGLLNLLVGIGMVVFLLLDTAAQLQAANRELSTLDALKNSFLSTVSHELRTPLTAIKSAAWILEQGHLGPVEPAQLDLLQMISTHSSRLTRLINDILDYTKLETGHMGYHKEPVDLTAVLQQAARGCSPVFAGRGITFANEVRDTPVPADVDADRIVQVVTNLLANAAQFTPAGGRVRLRAEVVDVAEGRQAVVSVTDSGVGIPPEDRERIFDKFYQVDPEAGRKAGSTGLGLAICKAIIEEGHGGTIHAEANPEGGSTLRFTLPLAPAIPSNPEQEVP